MRTRYCFLMACVMGLMFSACTKTEYRPANNRQDYVIKTKDDSKTWGLRRNWDKEMIIPCEYDSIYSVYKTERGGIGYDVFLFSFFVAEKDNMKYVYDDEKRPLGEDAFTDVVLYDENPQNSRAFNAGVVNEAHTDQGIIYFKISELKWYTFGPAEDAFFVHDACLYKKDGKWGMLEFDPLADGYFKIKREVLPCIYDEIIYVLDYFWVRQNDNWEAVDFAGQTIDKPVSLLYKYLNLQSLTDQEWRERRYRDFNKLSFKDAHYVSVAHPQYVAY